MSHAAIIDIVAADMAAAGVPCQRFGDALLLQGDALALLPRLQGVADLLLTDWPYRVTSGGNTTGEMRGCFARDRYDNSGEFFPVVEWADGAPLVFDACAENADCIVMTTDRESGDARAAIEAAGFRFHRLLMWNKGTVSPNRWFMQPCEFAWYHYKGRARPITNPSSKALNLWSHRDETDHPTEKPVGLMRFWIEQCSEAGSIVLDPFMGTGTTLIAAMLSGRCGIGIEQDQQWFDAACFRMQRAVTAPQQTALFDAQGVVA